MPGEQRWENMVDVPAPVPLDRDYLVSSQQCLRVQSLDCKVLCLDVILR